MKLFYGNLKSNMDCGEALCEAKRKMIKDGKYARDVYWAPFIYVGDIQK